MKRKNWLTIILGLVVITLGYYYLRNVREQAHLPAYPISKGVSAPFAGFIGDKLIVAGGCNFSDIPAADGGKKVYYKASYILDISRHKTKWDSIPSLPEPMAYGATVSTSNSLIYIGGNNAEGSSSKVIRLTEEHRTFRYDSLPDLPFPIDNGAATLIDSVIYITGGNQNNEDTPQALLALDLRYPDQWYTLPSYPGDRRMQPILLGSGHHLYLIGGFDVQESPRQAILQSTIISYDIHEGEWLPKAIQLPLDSEGNPRCFVGGSGLVTNSYLVLAGGVNYKRFKGGLEGTYGTEYLRKPVEWYRFNQDLLFYNTKNSIFEIPAITPQMARAGGVLLHHKNMLYMICGETKPGVRTSDIFRIPFPNY